MKTLIKVFVYLVVATFMIKVYVGTFFASMFVDAVFDLGDLVIVGFLAFGLGALLGHVSAD